MRFLRQKWLKNRMDTALLCFNGFKLTLQPFALSPSASSGQACRNAFETPHMPHKQMGFDKLSPNGVFVQPKRNS
jgi:hypothetical protein